MTTRKSTGCLPVSLPLDTVSGAVGAVALEAKVSDSKWTEAAIERQLETEANCRRLMERAAADPEHPIHKAFTAALEKKA